MVDFSLAGKRIAVAGPRGMVGSALVRRLASVDCEVLPLGRAEADLTNQAATFAWLEQHRPDALIIAAAEVGGILANSTRPATFLYDNLAIEVNLVEGARRAGVAKLLMLGSTCIYPKLAPQPMPESSLLTGPLEPTNEWYAIAKIAGVKLCDAYRRQYGLNYISAMPTNLYGPFDNFDLQSSHVMPALIAKAHRAKLAGAETLPIWGTGTPRREFLHVDDLADACVFLMEHYAEEGPINIGVGHDVTINELAALVARTVGWQGRFVNEADKPDGTPRKLVDVTKLTALGWTAAISLEDGVRSAYEWYRENVATPQRLKIGAALMALALMLPAAPAAATTFYVSAQQGSDQADGLKPTSAFRTFGRITGQLQPGDRLVIEPGRYDEPLRLTKSGTPTAAIEVVGGPGVLPSIRDFGDAVAISADFIRLSRIDAASSGAMGSAITVQSGHHHVVISDTIAHDSGCGGIAALQTDYVEIRHNKVFGNGMRSPWQCSGISLYQATNIDDRPGFHNVISGNLVYGNMNQLPDPKLPASQAGDTTDGNGIIVDDFRHEQLWQGHKTKPYRAATLIENNVARGNGGRGVEVFLSDNVTVRNNTVSGNLLDAKMLPASYGEIYVAFAKSIKLFNNFAVAGTGSTYAVMVADSQEVEADHNVTVGGLAPGWGHKKADVAWGAHNLAGPVAGFADDAGANLHLTPQSAAIGRGDAALAPAEDIDADARPRTGAVDAGAYQFSR